METQTPRFSSASVGQPTGNKAMERFQQFIMKLAETRPNSGLTPPRKALLQDRLNQLISDYKTPDHPPYSAMVERAIKELHEKEGSTEEAISEFISKEYDDLPQAHSTFLRHHLGKLCECGYITMTRDKRYTIPMDTYPISNAKSKRKTHKRKSKCVWESDSHPKHKKVKKKDCEVDSIDALMVSRKHMQLAENDVNCEDKQNKGMMAANELECLGNLMSRKGDMDPPEFTEGISFAHGEEKLEGEQDKDQSELITVVDHLLPAENLLDRDSTSKGQSITTCDEGSHYSRLSVEKLDVPRDPSDCELSKSDFTEDEKDFQNSRDDGQMEQLEHQHATVRQASLTSEHHQPDTFKAESHEKMEFSVDKHSSEPPAPEEGGNYQKVEGHESSTNISIACPRRFSNFKRSDNYDRHDLSIPGVVPLGGELEVEPWVATDRKHKELKKYVRRKKVGLSNNEVSFKTCPGSILPIKLPYENRWTLNTTSTPVYSTELPNGNESMPSTSLVSPTELPNENQLLNDNKAEEAQEQPDVHERESFEDPPSPEECQQKMPEIQGQPRNQKPDTDESNSSSASTCRNMKVFSSLRPRSQRFMLVASKPDEI